jgi:hypothetical protein
MAAFLDGCRFNPTLGGTTDWTFSSAVTGYQAPALAGVVNGRLYKYRAESADLSQWEMGEGAYNTSTGVLARTTVLFNSSGTGTAAGQSGAGTKIIFSTVPQVAIVALKEDLISVEEANSFSAAQQAQARSNIGAALAISSVTNSLGSDVALNSSTYADGPSTAQGTSGTWLATATVTLIDSAGLTNGNLKLWDGTTVIDSCRASWSATSFSSVSLSGVITNPVANIKVSCISGTSTSTMKFNASGNSKDSTLTVVRIG